MNLLYHISRRQMRKHGNMVRKRPSHKTPRSRPQSTQQPWPYKVACSYRCRPSTLKPLPKGSNVVPFWVCYGFSVRDSNIVPKKELHRRVWVNPYTYTLDPPQKNSWTPRSLLPLLWILEKSINKEIKSLYNPNI